jgi:cytochrome c551/c552
LKKSNIREENADCAFLHERLKIRLIVLKRVSTFASNSHCTMMLITFRRGILSLFLSIIFLACNNQNNTPVTNNGMVEKNIGQALFNQNCAACHSIKTQIIGPALADVESRWKDKGLLVKYIQNSQEVIKQDEYARQLYEKFNKSIMPPFPTLTDDNVQSILKYINENSK